jgi:dTDP-4-dehydrorhamnose reductase
MPSVLVLGARGMMGQMCVDVLSTRSGLVVAGTQRHDPSGRHYVDVTTSSGDLERELQAAHWDYVVNAIGVLRSLINIRDLDSVRTAVRVNGVVPHELAAAAERGGARVIHISTDAVFGAHCDEPYTEGTPTSAQDFYGQTKALGECDATHVINVRCSLVGRDRHHRRGLVEWLLGLRPGDAVDGFVDYTWTAATTRQVAELCARLVNTRTFDALRAHSGVFHFAPNPPMSKYDFIRSLVETAALDIHVSPVAHPGGAVRRVLATQFPEFEHLIPTARPWSAVLNDALNLEPRVSR